MSVAAIHRLSPVFETVEGFEGYQSLLLDLPEGEGPAAFDGRSVTGTWPSPPVYLQSPLLPQPDFWYVWRLGSYACLPAVIEQVEPFFSWAGELLPLRGPREHTALVTLNITNVIDVLDWSIEAFQAGQMPPSFVAHRLGEPGLFKVPLLPSVMFSLDWQGEDSFLARVQEHQLTGISFTEVWNSGEGALVANLVRP